MKVLVTGGAGFIGEHVTKKLLNEGYEVVIIDNFSTGRTEKIPNAATFYEVSIEDRNLETIFANEEPDFVIHLAAQVSVTDSMNHPFMDCLSNIAGSVNLLENSIKYKIKKFIFASSAAVYGEPEYLPIDELHSLNPISFYSLSKLTAEKYIHLFEKHFGLNYSILRFSNVFGPGQNAKGEAGVISIFLDRLFENKQPIVYGGEQTRDFIYVKDVVEAIFKAMTNEKNGTFNISTNTETKINDLLKHLYSTLQSEVNPEYQGARDGDILNSRLDNSRIKKELDWHPEFSLQAGLAETIDYFTQQLYHRAIIAETR